MNTDNVIAGQVVEVDDDTAADENVPPAPETYFHKVAGPQRSTAYSPGYAADETPVAADPTATDPDLPVVDTTAADAGDPYDADEAAEREEPVPAASAVPASAVSASGSVTAVSDTPGSLFGDTTTLMEQWRQAAVEFVDDPRTAVSHAADVAAEAVSRLETALRDQRTAWDGNGNGHGQTDTEVLRQAILGYRRFLDKLVS